ncbi:MAG: hypothetical protein ACI4AO_04390 [Anaerotignum sp.]
MKQFVYNLVAIAAVAFTLSFFTGMSVSVMYQEHQTLKPFIAAQEAVQEDTAVLSAIDFDGAIPDFS